MLTAASATLAFTLGLRHALDADHVAAIDGLTRWNAGEGRKLAPYCGALFSAGHSGAIFVAVLAFATFAARWQPPTWLGPVGIVISAVTLLVLSAMNLWVATSSGDRATSVFGLRSSLFAPLLRSARAWQVMALGALFAVSFDALALAGLFAMLTEPADRLSGALLLATLFASGMIAIGAANGVWVARLVRHSHVTCKHATRLVAFAVGLAGLCVAACAVLTLAVPSFEHWFAANELILSALVVTFVLAGYCFALSRQRNDPTTSPRATLGSTAAHAPSTMRPSIP